MAAMVRTDTGIDHRLVQLASNPARLQVLEFLAARTASPGEVAVELAMSVATARQHVAELQRMGLIELADQRSNGREVERFYRSIALPMWMEEDLGELSLEERLRLGAWIMQLVGCDAAEALKAGTFNARIDSHASRTRMVVDEQGWRELNQIQNDALYASFAVQAASAERLAEGDCDEIHVMGALLCVEMPAPKRPA